MDQVGTKTVNSTDAVVDSTPPVTTTNAVATYPKTGGTIVLTATDAGGSGVKSISYRDGASGAFTTTLGSSVSRPINTAVGSHTLYYYATDNMANQELQKSVTYTVYDPSAVTLSPVYRFYNKKNGSHFYTIDPAEKANVEKNLSATYKYEAVVYRVSPVQIPGSTPVYRFYNKKNGSHFYTTDPAEKANTQKNLSATYQYEAVVYYVMSGQSAGTTPVYRFYNKKNGSHFYTTDRRREGQHAAEPLGDLPVRSRRLLRDAVTYPLAFGPRV